MRVYKENSPVFAYLQRARIHYSELGIPEKNDDTFFAKLGLSKKIYKNWYNLGIKPIYHRILDLLDELRKVKDELKEVKSNAEKLQKELNELLNKK